MPLLCFASPKGGVGKTTLAANVAWELTRLGHSVLALDLDPQNTLRLHFGMALHDGAGLMPVLRQGGHWRQALRTVPSGPRLLPHGALSTQDSVALGAILAADPGRLVAPVREMIADPEVVVVVDTPPGPSPMLAAIGGAIDLTVAVLLADATSVSLIPALEHEHAGSGEAAERLVFVVNQLDIRSRLARATSDTMRRHFGNRLLALIYRDEHAAEAIAAQQPIGVFAPNSRAAEDFAAVARILADRLEQLTSTAIPTGLANGLPGGLPGLGLGAPPLASYAARWRA